ncbi:hypothetical protein [Thermus scotoductus]|nr:hypothetical protein [Thermus scotoductus]
MRLAPQAVVSPARAAGAPAARAGDTTACGASLIGVQGKVYIG